MLAKNAIVSRDSNIAGTNFVILIIQIIEILYLVYIYRTVYGKMNDIRI